MTELNVLNTTNQMIEELLTYLDETANVPNDNLEHLHRMLSRFKEDIQFDIDAIMENA